MIKRNKGILALTSVVILLPTIIGLLLWNKLPEQVPTHWGINGEVDGWSSKAWAVFGLPGMMLVLHWLCFLATLADPKRDAFTKKMLTLVLWICPVISLLIGSLIYTKVLGMDLDVPVVMSMLVGLIFLVIGNLLPKMRQSYTMGIKLPWTLANEENWNKTHRMSGKLWVAGGIVILATAWLGSFWILLGVLIVMVIVPTVYSYRLYRKQK